jgi:hypothetical protein
VATASSTVQISGSGRIASTADAAAVHSPIWVRLNSARSGVVWRCSSSWEMEPTATSTAAVAGG